MNIIKLELGEDVLIQNSTNITEYDLRKEISLLTFSNEAL